MDSKFPIKGRYIIAIWLIPYLYFPGMDQVFELIPENSEGYWYDLAYYYYFYATTILLFAALIFYSKLKWQRMFSAPNIPDYPGAIELTAFVFIFSIAAAYALFYPLSFVWPKFVNYWFIDIPPLIYFSQNEFPVLPNLLSFLSLVVFTPIIEEFLFRGILLHRWSDKWNLRAAIICSSLLFGIAHPDPIGAFAFGVAMSVLYLKTQTLLVPIACHGLNNAVAWLLEAGYLAVYGPEYQYTLEQFQSEWMVGLVCGLIVLVWAYIYLRKKHSQTAWRLPVI